MSHGVPLAIGRSRGERGGRGWEEQGSREGGESMTREKGEVWIAALIPCRRLKRLED